MLTPDELHKAVVEAEKAAGVCGRFCRVVGEHSDDNRYRLSHNCTGPTTTDSQVVHATPVLGLGKEALAKKLASWIEGIHAGAKVDLNATMATGGPISGAPYIVGERGPELFVPTRGPAMAGWPWPVRHDITALVTWMQISTASTNVSTTWRWSDGTAP